VSTIGELLERKSSGSGLEIEIKALGDPPHWLRDTLLSARVGANFTNKRLSLDRYTLLADQGRSLFCYTLTFQSFLSLSGFSTEICDHSHAYY
jgi:hypothetical protein